MIDSECLSSCSFLSANLSFFFVGLDAEEEATTVPFEDDNEEDDDNDEQSYWKPEVNFAIFEFKLFSSFLKDMNNWVPYISWIWYSSIWMGFKEKFCDVRGYDSTLRLPKTNKSRIKLGLKLHCSEV